MKTASDNRRAWALPNRVVLAVLATAAVGAVLIGTLWAPGVSMPPVSKVTIAVPMQISSAAAIVASSQGLFKNNGVEVVSVPFKLGRDALQSVLDGHADLALVADTPLMFALIGGAPISILAGVSQGRRSLAVVGRKDHGVGRLQDLQGKSVGLSLRTNLTYFLDAMLQVHGIPSESVGLVDLPTPEIVRRLLSGNIDAAVLYQPILAEVEQQMGDRISVLYGEDIYSNRFFLTGKTAYIDGHPHEIRRILSGLIAANASIQSDPIVARKLVADAIKVKDETLARIFDPDAFMVSLDQAMLLALDDQTRWAMKRGLVKAGPIPNYLNSIKYQHLEALLPGAVTVVR